MGFYINPIQEASSPKGKNYGPILGLMMHLVTPGCNLHRIERA